MSHKNSRSKQSNPKLILAMHKLKRYLFDTNEGRSFVTVARKNVHAVKAQITTATQSFVDANEVLDNEKSQPNPLAVTSTPLLESHTRICD